MQVSDVMTKNVVTIGPEEPVAVAARTLSRSNVGSLPVPFTATLRCDMPVTHPKVVDLQTGAFIGFDLTLQPDETLDIYRSTSDRLACTLTRAGVTENIFAKLDEDSTLTELQPGDNVLSMQAENGSGYLQTSVSFYPMEAGILPEPL